jgi:hypothetical protein
MMGAGIRYMIGRSSSMLRSSALDRRRDPFMARI